ncbi:MAG: hypothetical protein IKY00_06315 [Clostridia bacterium]|nr:hypothetical protein [Clostridia bacterium]
MAKIVSVIMTFIMFICPWANIPEVHIEQDKMKTNYTYVFIHGLGGWGENTVYYDLFPYWGVLGGDMMKYLNARGIECVAPSVTLNGSAWDRACEAYAQLTGTRVDYGAEHSKRCNHPRFGKNYTGRAMLKSWSSEDKINLMGHSFGGATMLELVELMMNGSEAERKATPAGELSPLFEGGKGDWIYSVTGLASPYNGTTAVPCKDVINAKKIAPLNQRLVVAAVGGIAGPIPDGRAKEDCAAYDLDIDPAIALTKTWHYSKDIYYFSVPCCMTDTDENGVTTCDESNFEFIYAGAATVMCEYTGTTPGGVVCDESWQPNDGMVNTISARAPFNARSRDYSGGRAVKGVFNVYPVYRGDHMSLMGGLFLNNNIREFYLDLIMNINSQ